MLKLGCDDCNCRLYDDEEVYCKECYDRDQKLISELQDEIMELKKQIR